MASSTTRRCCPPLFESTADRFNIVGADIEADKGYLSDTNLRAITEAGAHPFVPFKSNTTGKGSPLWERLYAQFILNRELWDSRYHVRSQSESVFSSVKAKSGDAVRSKSETGQTNEVLLKFLCHNYLRSQSGNE